MQGMLHINFGLCFVYDTSFPLILRSTEGMKMRGEGKRGMKWKGRIDLGEGGREEEEGREGVRIKKMKGYCEILSIGNILHKIFSK